MKKRKLPINFRKPPTVHKGRIKHSKRVSDRIKAVNSLCSAIDGFKERAVKGYRGKLGGFLREGETLPDQGLALDLAGRSIRAAIDRLTDADDTYCHHVNARQVLVKVCDHVARDEVYPELVDVRQQIDRRFGRKFGREVHGLQGATLRKPNRLHPQVSALVRRLAIIENLPEPKRPGPPKEVETWRRQLKPGSDKLGDLLQEIVESETREEMLRNDRDFELEAFDADYSEALDYVRATFRIAGLDTSWIWSLLPTAMRRRLKAKARQESEARVEGRRAIPEAENGASEVES